MNFFIVTMTVVAMLFLGCKNRGTVKSTQAGALVKFDSSKVATTVISKEIEGIRHYTFIECSVPMAMVPMIAINNNLRDYIDEQQRLFEKSDANTWALLLETNGDCRPFQFDANNALKLRFISDASMLAMINVLSDQKKLMIDSNDSLSLNQSQQMLDNFVADYQKQTVSSAINQVSILPLAHEHYVISSNNAYRRAQEMLRKTIMQLDNL